MARFRPAAFGAFAVAVAFSGSPLMASETEGGADEVIGAVQAFNRICYAQVPRVQGIRNMALQLGWKPLSSDELSAFSRIGDGRLEGWDVQLGVEFYRLGVSQGGVSPELAAQFPDFANGTTTACSLVLGDEQSPETVMAGMQELAGKAPLSEAVDEGDVLTTTWAGGNDSFKVFLFNKVSKTGDGGILNVTLVSKE